MPILQHSHPQQYQKNTCSNIFLLNSQLLDSLITCEFCSSSLNYCSEKTKAQGIQTDLLICPIVFSFNAFSCFFEDMNYVS